MRMDPVADLRPRAGDFQHQRDSIHGEPEGLEAQLAGVVVQTAPGRRSALALEKKGRLRAPLEFGNGGIHQRGLFQNPGNTTSCGDAPRRLG